MSDLPLEYALVRFEGNKFSGEIVPALLDLAERGIVRFDDIVFIQKDADGGIRTFELNNLDQESYKIFVPLGQQIDSIFTEEDLSYAAGELPDNSSAVLFLWENLWLENLRSAVLNSGGVMVERGQIPAELVDQIRQELASQA